jgi:ANTAR domain-containing protein
MTTDTSAEFSARAAHELAAGTSLLTVERDVIGTVTMLLACCLRATGATAAGALLAVPQSAGLDLLATTGQSSAMLPLWQTQVRDGPSTDVVRTGEAQWAESGDSRWPDLTVALRHGGLGALHSSPMKWSTDTIGVLDLVFGQSGSPSVGVGLIAQAFADLTTLAIVQPSQLPAGQIVGRLRSALDKRAVIEQAKGVIAYLENLTIDEAFDRLMQRAAERRQPLTIAASETVNAPISAPPSG